jgi:PTH2 family peptidyl-tRNA hydrolase
MARSKSVEFKQVLVLRSDLGMSPGKMAAQAAHASLLAHDAAPEEARRIWKKTGAKKVALKVATLKELLRLRDEARGMGLPFGLVEDAGHTELPPGSVTALGIGPAPEADVDRLTGDLPLQ